MGKPLRPLLLLITLTLLAPALSSNAQMPTESATAAAGATEGNNVPTWLDSAVVYENFTRTISPEGNLNGVTKRLDYLQKLGVNVLWLMPLNPFGQVKKKGTFGSPYSIRDYYAINPAYGTKDDLRRLIDEAHRRQMKVIIDIVANHTSFDSVMMSHPSFYKHDAQGKILWPYDWSD